MKRLLFLGAARHQVPAIESARRNGFTVFTADNRPDNPGHSLADQAFNVSATDIPSVIRLAGSLAVDGVLGYASEVCARAAAQAAAVLRLPSAPLDAVETLSCKDRFRSLLHSHGLQQAGWHAFAANQCAEALDFARTLPGGCVIKPVDNSGGRGVSVCPDISEFTGAFSRAAAASWQGRVIVEEFVRRCGSQLGGDGWMENGRLKFLHFLDNSTLPPPADGAAVQERFPSFHPPDHLRAMRDHLEIILRTAGYLSGPLNFDGCFLDNGRPFVFEIAPRNGGNFIPAMILLQTGVDLTEAAVLASVVPDFELPLPAHPPPPRFHGTWVLHSRQPGIFRGVRLQEEIRPHVVECIPYCAPGAPVRPYQTSGDMLGVLLLAFPTAQVMENLMDRMPSLCIID